MSDTLHKSEIKDNLAWASRQLRAGAIRPDVAKSMGYLQGKQISMIVTEMAYAKDNGQQPFIPEMETEPVTHAATTLAKAGANKRATANSRS